MKMTAINLTLTTKCTLRCKDCLIGMPYVEKPANIPLNEVMRDVDQFFSICESGWDKDEPLFRDLDLCCGECLLYPELLEISEQLIEYGRFFQEIRLAANCTLLPSEPLLKLMRKSTEAGIPYVFHLNNYGKYSPKWTQTIELLNEYGVPYREHIYCGEDQYCGGWIDMSLNEEKKSPEEALDTFKRCRFATRTNDCAHLMDGYFIPCAILFREYLFGKSIDEIAGDEIIKLSGRVTLEEKRDAFYRMTADPSLREQPYKPCCYCKGYDPENRQRFPAAQQL